MKSKPVEFVRELIASRKFAVINAAGDSVSLPATEYAVLVTLANMQSPSHGPAIAEAAEGRIPLATVYSALRRMQEKGCALSETQEFEVASSKVRRTLWQATVRQLNNTQVLNAKTGTTPLPETHAAVG